MKLELLVAIPLSVVTLIEPVVASVGTVAVIRLEDTTPKLAPIPLNITAVASLKSVPVMVTFAPTGPLVGAKVVMVGAGITVKVMGLVAVPPVVVTLIGPEAASVGTVAVISVEDTTPKPALVLLNITAVAPVKSVPVMVTLVPTGPLVGAKVVMVGAGITVKLMRLVAVPPGVVTLIGPEVASAGTVAVISVEDTTPKLASIPLNITAVAPVKSVPVMVRFAPTGPLVGVKVVIVGAGVTILNKVTRLSAGRPTTSWSLALSYA